MLNKHKCLMKNTYSYIFGLYLFDSWLLYTALAYILLDFSLLIYLPVA